MAEIYNNKGFILVASVLVMALLLLMSVYLVSFVATEIKISNSQSIATKTYYLAESGINAMVWKIQHNTATGLNFIEGDLSSADSISQTNIFGDTKATYQVAAINTVPAEAWIIATSTYQISDTVSQRVVKYYISRATGDAQEWNYNVFAGGRGSQQNGNFTFTGSGVVLVSNGGRLHANQVLKIQGAEIIVNDGIISSSNNISVVAGGQLTLNNSVQEAPTTTVDVLPIDFDSEESTSWKNRATITYTETQFKNLPDNSTLTGIIFVSGDARITNKNMTINGVLVAQEAIEIDNTNKTITVNNYPGYGGGLLAKANVHITTSGGTVLVNGLVYAGDNLEIISSNTNFTINGGMAGFDAKITVSGGAITLNHTPETFREVVDPAYNGHPPVIQIDHWEEQY